VFAADVVSSRETAVQSRCCLVALSGESGFGNPLLLHPDTADGATHKRVSGLQQSVTCASRRQIALYFVSFPIYIRHVLTVTDDSKRHERFFQTGSSTARCVAPPLHGTSPLRTVTPCRAVPCRIRSDRT